MNKSNQNDHHAVYKRVKADEFRGGLHFQPNYPKSAPAQKQSWKRPWAACKYITYSE